MRRHADMDGGGIDAHGAPAAHGLAVGVLDGGAHHQVLDPARPGRLVELAFEGERAGVVELGLPFVDKFAVALSLL